MDPLGMDIGWFFSWNSSGWNRELDSKDSCQTFFCMTTPKRYSELRFFRVKCSKTSLDFEHNTAQTQRSKVHPEFQRKKNINFCKKVIQPQIWSRLWAGWRCQSIHFGGPPEPGEIEWLYICMFSQLLDVLQHILASGSVPTDVTYQHTLLSMRCMLYDTVQQAGSTSWLSLTAAMWLVQSPHESKTIGVAWSCALPLCLALLLEFVFSGIRCHCEGTGSRFHGQLLPEWPKTNCYLSNRWNQHSMKVRKTNFYPSNFFH